MFFSKSEYYKNKTVWITGASSGIGEALTYELIEQDAQVIISARRISELERVRNNCKYPNKITIVPLDVTDVMEVFKATKEMVIKFGKIDIAILNAGISQRSLMKDTILPVEKKIMEVNFFGATTLTKALLPSMIQHQLGHFVVISSLVGKFGVALRSSYAASKHALHGYYDSLRGELHEHHIKVTLVCPGYIKTNISINAMNAKGEKHNKMDETQKKGWTPKRAAKRILKAVRKGKREIYFGGFETLGVPVKRFFPGVFARVIAQRKTTEI